HAPIDSILSGNRIHDCRLGLWMDWQAQGTRITGNLVYDNECDLFIEVSHGPCVVDNNLLLSPYSLNLCAQGGAFIHNLIAGTINPRDVTRRATPYHQPHSTAISGMTFVFAGDDRYFNNLFVAPDAAAGAAYGGIQDENDDPASVRPAVPPGQYGLGVYDGHPSSLEEYLAALEGRRRRPGALLSLGAYYETRQPVYTGGNLYYNQARPFSGEHDAVVRGELQHGLRLEQAGDRLYLCLEADAALKDAPTAVVVSEKLGAPRIAGAPYENPDGSRIVFDRDYQGRPRAVRPRPGPLETLKPGPNRLLVWGPAE
ncbi:MAG: hypothetical protein LC725_04955, partial [Lentisphaerae bacterium]|nr:hypothetical protein [Lentisphaerota bacterium]